MKNLTLLILICSTFFIVSCSNDSDNSEGAYTVKYNVSSKNTMNVTYTDVDGTLKTVNNVSSQWTYSFKTSGNGRVVKLSITSTNGSAVSGSIYINGQESTQDNSDSGSVTMTAQIP